MKSQPIQQSNVSSLPCPPYLKSSKRTKNTKKRKGHMIFYENITINAGDEAPQLPPNSFPTGSMKWNVTGPILMIFGIIPNVPPLSPMPPCSNYAVSNPILSVLPKQNEDILSNPPVLSNPLRFLSNPFPPNRLRIIRNLRPNPPPNPPKLLRLLKTLPLHPP